MKAFTAIPVTVFFLLAICQMTYCQRSLFFRSSDYNSVSKKPARNTTVLETWQGMEKKFKNTVNAGVKMILPFVIETFGKANVSKQCLKDSMHLLSGIKEIRPWAMRFLDSSAKFIDGILAGSFSSLGEYDECVNTEVRSSKLSSKGKLLFRGQYCSINLRPHIPEKPVLFGIKDIPEELRNFSQRDTVIAELAQKINFFHLVIIRMGVCVPSGCKLEDVNNIVSLFDDYISMDVEASRCETKEENEFRPLIIFVMTCFSTLGFLMLVGTAVDLYSYYSKAIFKSNAMRILLAFSFFSNFQKFSNTTQGKITCLDGIRVLCMSWITVSHTYMLMNPYALKNTIKAEEGVKKLPFQLLINGTFAVDTFFFMGGLLVCYLSIKYCVIKKNKFPVFKYILHRILRIYPTYIFIILSTFVILSLTSSGPLRYDTLQNFEKSCQENWWWNLLFINNFFHPDNQCLPQTWYIAADFQLYVGALIIVLPMIWRPKVGIALAVLSIIACILYSGVYTYIHNLPPTVLVSTPDIEYIMNGWFRYLIQPFPHISSYALGILAGYLLITKPNLKISPGLRVIGWAVAFTLSFTVVYCIRDWNSGVRPSMLSTILYASTSRTAWTLGVAWMVICCATGNGGVINYILCWKIWVPLSRITFLAYLIHPMVIIIYFANFRYPIQLDHFILVWMFFGHLLASYGIAFALYMLIELPFTNIEKIFLGRSERKVEDVPTLDVTVTVQSNLESNNNPLTSPPKSDEESGRIDNKTVIYKL